MGRLTTRVDESWFSHTSRAEAMAGGLALQWLGTAGFRLVSNDHHVWLDPHLSRHSLWQVATQQLAPNAARIDADVDQCHAICVGHSHFDHAIDTPFMAKAHNARVYGSESTLNLCRGHGVGESQLVRLDPGERHTEGPFSIRGVPSQHSTFAFGRVPAPGKILAPLDTPARAEKFRVGDVLGLHLSCDHGSVYHIGSADLIEAELTGVQADVVLCCTVGRYATENFTHRVLDALKPKLVIPCHWDQFWRSMDKSPRQIPGNDLGGFLAEVQSHPSRPEVRVLPQRGWTRLA
ncbi:MAG: MBL fold metallo-hydrolase [Myxococcales bacterium]|nr:MBL fold metallo-hydrolase [Myxococcales bacterium]